MTAPTLPARSAVRDAVREAVRGAAHVAGAALAWQAVRLARAIAHDVAEHRRGAAVLRRAWTHVALDDAPRPLRLHARVAEHAGAAHPPVVLVHGYGVSGRYFVPLAGRLAPTLRVYAPDLPGHGHSDRAPAPLAIPALAVALGAWMEAWGLRGAVLVGQSMGAQIATELALRAPALVSGLVLVGPTVDPTARSAVRQMARAARGAIAERPLLDLCVAADYVQAGPQLVVGEMRRMLAHRLEELLPALTVPMRLVRGARDHVAPQAWVEAVAATVGAAPPTVVPRWGHAVQYAAPDVVCAEVHALIAELQQAAPSASTVD